MAIHAFGIDLQMGDGGDPENFTSLAEVLDVNGPGMTADTVEVTPHDPSGNKWKKFLKALRDGGEVTFDINFEPTESTHDETTGLLAELDSDDLRNFKLIFPDGSSTTWDFSGYVTNFNPNGPVQEALTASITIKLSGKPGFMP